MGREENTMTTATMTRRTFETGEVQVGDFVRSHDFEDWSSLCYVEGVVFGIDTENFPCARYMIRCTRRVWEGREIERERETVYPPVNGTKTWLGRTMQGVEKIDN
jgi:hypothetical protein